MGVTVPAWQEVHKGGVAWTGVVRALRRDMNLGRAFSSIDRLLESHHGVPGSNPGRRGVRINTSTR